MAAARKRDEDMKETVGVSAGTITRLKDCVAQYRDDGRGYWKYYPGGLCVWLNLRHAGVADATAYVRERKNVVFHVRIDKLFIYVECFDFPRVHKTTVSLFRSFATDAFRRMGDWSNVADPDRLEAYCLQLYEDFSRLSER